MVGFWKWDENRFPKPTRVSKKVGGNNKITDGIFLFAFHELGKFRAAPGGRDKYAYAFGNAGERVCARAHPNVVTKWPPPAPFPQDQYISPSHTCARARTHVVHVCTETRQEPGRRKYVSARVFLCSTIHPCVEEAAGGRGNINTEDKRNCYGLGARPVLYRQ